MSRSQPLCRCLCFLTVLAAITSASAQRIASISTIDATLRYDQNNPLDNGTTSTGEINRQTTVLDVFVRPGTNSSEQFRFNINTFSSSGGDGASECNRPDPGGACRQSTPVSVTFETSPLRHRYELRLRKRIPYLYYHRRFLSCPAFTRSDIVSTSSQCAQDNVAERAECECQRTFTEPENALYTFNAFDAFTSSIEELANREATYGDRIIQSEFARNASLYFNAVVYDDDDGTTAYVPPAPVGDVDESTIYVLSHVYDVIAFVTPSPPSFLPIASLEGYRSNYVGRATGPFCYVYDINSIPEQLVHVTITLTPDDNPQAVQRLTLSTINEANSGNSTSGSSIGVNFGEGGAFTARIENTQSASSSYGPNLGGSIVMCPDPSDPDSQLTATFINTNPINENPDLTVNPWREAFADNLEEAAGRVFDAESLNILRAKPPVAADAAHAGIYYYDWLETRTVGDQCGQVGVTNSIYSYAHPQIASVVNQATVQSVSVDLIRGNESYPTALPSCFPGFGPSVGANTPLPGRMLASQRKYRQKYLEDPGSVGDPPHVPPYFNTEMPNVWFRDRYMYYEAEANDVEVEVIMTVSGSFLQTIATRPDGEIRADASACNVLVEQDAASVAGELSVLVCNSAERVQIDAPDADMASNDFTTLSNETTIDQTLRAEFGYGVQASASEDSGIRIRSRTGGEASQIKFTSALEPGLCERVTFDLTLTAETLNEETSFVLVELLSTEAQNNPSAMILDSVQISCVLTNNYVRPNTTDEGDIDTQLVQPPAPEVIDEPDKSLERIAHVVVSFLVFGIPTIAVFFSLCMGCYFYGFTKPRVSKYI